MAACCLHYTCPDSPAAHLIISSISTSARPLILAFNNHLYTNSYNTPIAMVQYLPWSGAEIERLMKEADDRAVAKQAKKEAAEEAARDKSIATIYKASQTTTSKLCSHISSTGDAKKGAGLFKVRF